MRRGCIYAAVSSLSGAVCGFKRWVVSLVITPDRVRKAVAFLVSWLLVRVSATRTWDSVSSFTCWLHRMADFLDKWNATDLPDDKDRLVADLVKRALTDDDVSRLIDMVTSIELKQATDVPAKKEA